MKVCIIEKITYDYYRFSDIVGVAGSVDAATQLIKRLEIFERRCDRLAIKPLRTPIVFTREGSDVFKSTEQEHYFIRTWESVEKRIYQDFIEAT